MATAWVRRESSESAAAPLAALAPVVLPEDVLAAALVVSVVAADVAEPADDAALDELPAPDVPVTETVEPEAAAADAEAVPDTAALEVAFVPLAGAGTASEGSTSAPVPHGMASPLGCVELAGSVVLPFASAIAKRVVQYVAVELGDVNW